MEEEAKRVQTRLIHANKMTSLGMLVSGVAHEINNPNSYIMSNVEVFSKIWKDAAEFLKKAELDRKETRIGGIPFDRLLSLAPQLLDGIHDGSVRINSIVESLRNFSVPDRSGLDGKVDINAVMLSASSILENQIKKCTHHFYVQCAVHIPPVLGSRQQVEQVIINLIMNALQSLPDNTSGVWVTSSHNTNDNAVEINVTDEGAGMTEEVLQKVTEPFFTTNADRGGTGLGLSISYTIIRDHKGTLSFASEEGRGTTVTVSLPVYSKEVLTNEIP